MIVIINNLVDFPGGPVVKNLPCNAGDAGLFLVRETKTSHVGQLSPHAGNREACALQLEKACMLQERPSTARNYLKKKKEQQDNLGKQCYPRVLPSYLLHSIYECKVLITQSWPTMRHL